MRSQKLDEEKKMLRTIPSTQPVIVGLLLIRESSPDFYAEYFGIYNLQLSDYAFYFDRQFDNADICITLMQNFWDGDFC